MAGRIGRWGLAVGFGGLWWWAVLRLVLAPGAGVVEGTVAAGGWGLSLLPVHCAPKKARGAWAVGDADAAGTGATGEDEGIEGDGPSPGDREDGAVLSGADGPPPATDAEEAFPRGGGELFPGGGDEPLPGGGSGGELFFRGGDEPSPRGGDEPFPRGGGGPGASGAVGG
ncbi:hypothetical protein GCM10010358_25880 [Streptomyces minutiscleroticus]|uniref:Uncharacterized protein n=1 Tax=Streptomyces minutiscleroticus TaxID=68238 RepID=A0A918NIN5_9ACTN|nr:hypothetical protein GCM10010358_25880 [Streptomyces minutiscleroticus]